MTFSYASAESCYVQDPTGGVRVQLSEGQVVAEAGQRIDLRGTVAAAGKTPTLVDPHFTLLGPGRLPPPIPITADTRLDDFLYRRVLLTGVAQSAMEDTVDLTGVQVNSNGKLVPAQILSPGFSDSESYVDAEVRVTGVLVDLPENGAAGESGAILVPSFADVEILKPARPPETAPVSTISDLLRLKLDKLPPHRVRVRGHGDLSPSNGLSLEDGSGRISVLPARAGLEKFAGSLDIAGFLSARGDEIVIQEAVDAAAAPGREKGLPVLRTALAIHRLSAAESLRRYPARVRAVVTFSDPHNGVLFVQDPTDGIFVSVEDQQDNQLRPGDLVEVSGETAPGGFAPTITRARIRRIGRAPLPVPDGGELERTYLGLADSRWVEFSGVIQAVEPGSRESVAYLVQGTHRVQARILAPVKDIKPLVNREVRLRGVCGALFNNRRQLLGIVAYVPGRDFIQATAATPADPFDLPVRPIETLLQYSREAAMGHHVRFQGVVTSSQRSGPIWVRDATGAVQVRSQDEQKLSPGDLVDVVGFPHPGPYSPIVRGGVVRKIASGEPPRAAVISAASALNGKYDGNLVQITGTLLDWAIQPGGHSLLLESGDLQFTGQLPGYGAITVQEAGSLVRVTGICSVLVDDSRDTVRPRGFRVLLRTPADLVVLKPAPWLTFRRLLPISGTALLMAGAALLWASRLRRRVRAQTKSLALKTADLEKAHRHTTNALRRAQEAESMEQAHKDVLELVARDEDLDDVLMRLARSIEEHCLGISCSIQLVLPGGKRLNASPQLPPEWQQLLAEIGIDDFCGNGVHALEELSANPAWSRLSASGAAGRLRRFCLVKIQRESRTIGVIVAFLSGEITLRRSEQEFLDSAAKLAALAVQRRILYDQLSYRARHDQLTGLENRSSLFDRLSREIAMAAGGGSLLGVIYIDLDNFKMINDTYGHPAGDMVLKEVSRRMLATIRRSDTLARLGGDEFCVLLPSLGRRADAERVASFLSESLSRPIEVSGGTISVRASVGISIFPDDGDNAESLLQAADLLMYEEKGRHQANGANSENTSDKEYRAALE